MFLVWIKIAHYKMIDAHVSCHIIDYLRFPNRMLQCLLGASGSITFSGEGGQVGLIPQTSKWLLPLALYFPLFVCTLKIKSANTPVMVTHQG